MRLSAIYTTSSIGRNLIRLSTGSPATTTIYGDKVAINVSIDKPIVIIIRNMNIADGYRNYFEFLWKKAGKG